MSIVIKGIEDVVNGLAATSREIKTATQRAMYEEGERIMTVSQTLVPRSSKTGPLADRRKNAGRGFLANSKFVRLRNGVVELGYSAWYAVFVHEVQARHMPPTQWKFLEKPLKDEAANIPKNIAEKVKRLVRQLS